MLLTEYPEAEHLSNESIVIIDGPNGTQKMPVPALIQELLQLVPASEFAQFIKSKSIPRTLFIEGGDTLLVGTDDGLRTFSMQKNGPYWNFLDKWCGPDIHRLTYRGYNIGADWETGENFNSVTEQQYAAIKSGLFDGLFIGDYWVINDIVWRIADMDYYFTVGNDWNRSEAATNHHLIIMPDTILSAGLYPMFPSNNTSGGILNSTYFYKHNGYELASNEALSYIRGAFGADHTLNHLSYLSNSCTNGIRYGCGWYTVDTNIPNEIQVYGARQCEGYAQNGNYGTEKDTQFALFTLQRHFIVARTKEGQRRDWWLDGIVTETNGCAASWPNNSWFVGVTTLLGYRPYFCLGDKRPA